MAEPLEKSPAHAYSKLENQVIALSAIAQAADLVDSIAQNGWCNNTRCGGLINSLFIFDPDSLTDIYPSLESLKPGLQCLNDILSKGADPQNQNTIRYILGMIQLANLLKNQKDLGDILQSRLKDIAPQDVEIYELIDNQELFADIAGAYLDTLAKLKFRIQITGNPAYLKDEEKTDKIRTLLLAGIRASSLWFQLGGSRLKIIFFRKKLLKTVKQLLAST